MSSKNTINIKNKDIEISDRFTLLLGDFREENIPYEYNGTYEIIKEFSIVNIRKFLELNDKISSNHATMQKSVDLTDYLRNYINSINSNIELVDEYLNIIDSLRTVLKYQNFINRKKQLLKELKIARAKKKSSDIAAETDLINKLKRSISENKTKLKYREEDFLYVKNQRDQIINALEDYQDQINKLNRKKKQAFNQINQITREMSKSDGQSTKRKLDINIGAQKNMSKSKIIRSLQKDARNYQEEIKSLKSKISEVKLKLSDLNPKFDKLKTNYETFLNIIKSDQKRLNKVKQTLNEKMEKVDSSYILENKINDIELIRQPTQIKGELDALNNSLNELKTKSDYISESGEYDFQKIQDQLTEINNILTSEKNRVRISVDKKKIISSIENFRNLEIFITELQDTINDFLLEINLELSLNFLLDEKMENLLLSFLFSRSNKGRLRFDNLTTPEKVFFAITFYIALKIVLKNQRIIFSNQFLPEFFNKRGSIFRTIRKTIPVLINKKKYQNYTLIFIISNLEMKKPIENLNVKKL